MLATTILCLAAAVYHESRGEPLKGQIAVSSVVLNRVKKHKSEVCTEINKPGQFPWAKDKFVKHNTGYAIAPNTLPKGTAWLASLNLAESILDGTVDTIPNLISFDSKPHPEWKLPKFTMIGNHYFYYSK